MTKTLKSELDTALKERIEKHKTRHKIEWYVMKENKRINCIKCGTPMPVGFSYVCCTEKDTEEGSCRVMWFCNQQHHNECIDSGYPFDYEVAIEIARSLGTEAGVISFTEWLAASVEGNAKIDLSPYFKRGDITVELGETPESLKDWEKTFLDETFEHFKQDTYQMLYESIVSSR